MTAPEEAKPIETVNVAVPSERLAEGPVTITLSLLRSHVFVPPKAEELAKRLDERAADRERLVELEATMDRKDSIADTALIRQAAAELRRLGK